MKTVYCPKLITPEGSRLNVVLTIDAPRHDASPQPRVGYRCIEIASFSHETAATIAFNGVAVMATEDEVAQLPEWISVRETSKLEAKISPDREAERLVFFIPFR